MVLSFLFGILIYQLTLEKIHVIILHQMESVRKGKTICIL